MLSELKLHPSIETAAELLIPRFTKYCISQDLLSHKFPDRVRWVLKYLPPDLAKQRAALTEQWTSDKGNDTTAKRWNTLKCFLQDENHNNVVKDIVLNAIYPRLDINVTTGKSFIIII